GLASKTRIKIIQLLSKKMMNVKDLAKELGVSSAITTMPVKKLEEANIIKTEQVGQQKISSLPVDKIVFSFPEKIFNAFDSK
ncbi:ArsR/SmtB family transcription factor, partial [Enterococcus faecium]|uniref:ArsR/SmtB family transcription factor n=1 Tax=Enterococcus faecium TaxID=1352 RepID=UPI003CC5E58E